MADIKYPFKKYNYEVQIDGFTSAVFSEISGFDMSIDVIEYRDGSDKLKSPRKMPGLTKYGNVTLKWGMTDNTEFYEWVAGIADGSKSQPEDRIKTVTINLQNDEHEPIASWVLSGAWPCKYTVTDFNASSSEVAFESIELTFEEMKREKI